MAMKIGTLRLPCFKIAQFSLLIGFAWQIGLQQYSWAISAPHYSDERCYYILVPSHDLISSISTALDLTTCNAFLGPHSLSYTAIYSAHSMDSLLQPYFKTKLEFHYLNSMDTLCYIHDQLSLFSSQIYVAAAWVHLTCKTSSMIWILMLNKLSDLGSRNFQLLQLYSITNISKAMFYHLCDFLKWEKNKYRITYLLPFSMDMLYVNIIITG